MCVLLVCVAWLGVGGKVCSPAGQLGKVVFAKTLGVCSYTGQMCLQVCVCVCAHVCVCARWWYFVVVSRSGEKFDSF